MDLIQLKEDLLIQQSCPKVQHSVMDGGEHLQCGCIQKETDEVA